MAEKRPPIYLYTDGSSRGNPGPGGWGAVLVCGQMRKEISGGEALTTNNRMELTAVIEGLKAIKWKKATVHIWSDSSYVVKAIEEGWLAGWLANGFRDKNKKKKKNEDLWLEYVEVSKGYDLHFHWLKGHAGHPENERCDAMAFAQASVYAEENKT
ncbi:MAG: ribonuclease HI [Bacteroidales bacterium]|nr:ribonuclease HI [Bacteroidales bacterium]MBR5398924.1 ribonuclease HI [Bacteroidales bacterium]